MNVVDEVGDLLIAIKRHAENLPPAARHEFFAGLENFGARAPVSLGTLERLEEEMFDYVTELEEVDE